VGGLLKILNWRRDPSDESLTRYAKKTPLLVSLDHLSLKEGRPIEAICGKKMQLKFPGHPVERRCIFLPRLVSISTLRGMNERQEVSFYYSASPDLMLA